MTQPPTRSHPKRSPPPGGLPEAARPDAAAQQSVFGSTIFGSTLFDPVLAPTPGGGGGTRLFGVCHVGVVRRTVLLVGLLVGVGAVFAVDGVAAWLALTAVGAAVALPGMLIWLLVACTL